MRKRADIDVFHDEALRKQMVTWSVVIFAGGVALAVFTLLFDAASRFGIYDFLWLVGLSLVALPVHELIHAAAYKLLVPGVRVSFGHKDGFLYTDAHGAMLRRSAAQAVLLAPAVVLTCAFLGVGGALGQSVLAILLASVHLSGCVGDILMVARIARHPSVTHVRDTDFGIELWEDR